MFNATKMTITTIAATTTAYQALKIKKKLEESSMPKAPDAIKFMLDIPIVERPSMFKG